MNTPPLPARGLETLCAWFASKGWTPRPFQRQTWDAYARGHSGLLHVPTGAGKTYAAYGGPLAQLIDGLIDDLNPGPPQGLRILYITPLRAVSRDIEKALKLPVEQLGLPITVESRTGDTPSSVRARQRARLPNVLVTTPESLSLQLSQPDAPQRLRSLNAVIIDEWHELLSSKRGTQVELALTRLRAIRPGLRTWALSATLANLQEAASAAVGVRSDSHPDPHSDSDPHTQTDQAPAPSIISADLDRPIHIQSLLPRPGDPFPWAGHLGLTQLPRVIESIPTGPDGLPADSTLLFVNTRSQAERWHSALHAALPAWQHTLALHHGSIDRDERERVEAGLKNGSVRVVVATSSLDLGVDFAPVERVLHIGSPKGIARLMQRAGRASHRPGSPCRVLCVPTHGLEMIEVAAVRRAIASGRIEPRTPEPAPLDVLAQHMVTVALGGGFTPDDLYQQVRTAYAYKDLPRQAFEWTLDLVVRGGETLRAYPEYRRVVPDQHGVHRVPDRRVATMHRLNVGTITSDAVMDLRFASGRRLGVIEEDFIHRLRPGQTFLFAGRALRFAHAKDLTAYVRPASGTPSLTPLWAGARLPISESLSTSVRQALAAVASGDYDPASEPELAAAAELVRTQALLSAVPTPHQTLAEIAATREGDHLFLFPFEGRLVHAGIAALLAYRLGLLMPATFSIASNDYGLELLCPDGFPFQDLLRPDLFTQDNLHEHTAASVNLSALAKAQFREVARVAGLVFQSRPGLRHPPAHTHARAGLIYDVFEQFDPDNLLLQQARREVHSRQFEQGRLARTLQRLASLPMLIRRIERPTPLSLPLVIERVGAKLSSESIADRVEKLRAQWAKATATPKPKPAAKPAATTHDPLTT